MTGERDYVVVDRQRLPHDGGTWELEGRDHLGVGASVIMVEMPPGRGVRLHRHPYPEIFVVHEGVATFTAGTDTLEVTAGQVVIVSAGVPHAFVNSGDIPLRQTDVHLSERFVTEWLED
jgi:mannose-6-phosphate isomerase-like protein (cupin superfamily)